jgi:hypothetical protein
MTIKPPAQTPFDDEISLLDIIQFFKGNLRGILFFVIIGGILGGIYGKNAGPMYKGSVLISPAKVAGQFVANPEITLTKLNMNSYYSKETFLSCNPDFYKDKDKDKDIDYDISDIVKASITKDGGLIELTMNQKNKAVIKNCLDQMINDIRQSQNRIAEPLIESKKIELSLAEEKLKISEEFRTKLNEKQIKELKTNDARFSADLLYTNMLMLNANNIEQIMNQLNKIKTELSSEQTKRAENVLPINIERKSYPSPKIGLLLGLFLGGSLGLFVSLFLSHDKEHDKESKN